MFGNKLRWASSRRQLLASHLLSQARAIAAIVGTIACVASSLPPAMANDGEAPQGHHSQRADAGAGPAIEAGRAALQEAEGTYGRNHPNVAPALSDLASLHIEAAQYDDAQALLSRALSILSTGGMSDTPAMARVLVNLGAIFNAQGSFAAAARLVHEATRVYGATGGSETAQHRDLYGALQWLGAAAQLEALRDDNVAQGRYAEAIPLEEKLYEIQSQLLPQGHYYRGAALSNLAAMYQKQGRFKEAETRFKQALSLLRQVWAG